MIDSKLKAEPAFTPHPGEHLKDFLESLDLSQAELAKRAGVSQKHINQIIAGKVGITSEIALAFEQVLGGGAEMWINLDARYRLAQARGSSRKIHERLIEWAREFPLRDLRRRGYLSSKRCDADAVGELLRFFGVSDSEQWEACYGNLRAQFRASPSLEASVKAQATYVRICEYRAEVWDLPAFDTSAFRQALAQVRGALRNDPQEVLGVAEELLGHAGVRLVLEPETAASRLSGAAIWPRRNKAILALTARFKTADHLWFSFFHEAAHILYHRGRTVLETEGHTGDLESEADRYARESLVSPDEYRALVERGRPSINEIERFAEHQGLPVDSVVGMLQHDRVLAFNEHNDVKRRVRLERLVEAK